MSVARHIIALISLTLQLENKDWLVFLGHSLAWTQLFPIPRGTVHIPVKFDMAAGSCQNSPQTGSIVVRCQDGTCHCLAYWGFPLAWMCCGVAPSMPPALIPTTVLCWESQSYAELVMVCSRKALGQGQIYRMSGKFPWPSYDNFLDYVTSQPHQIWSSVCDTGSLMKVVAQVIVVLYTTEIW